MRNSYHKQSFTTIFLLIYYWKTLNALYLRHSLPDTNLIELRKSQSLMLYIWRISRHRWYPQLSPSGHTKESIFPTTTDMFQWNNYVQTPNMLRLRENSAYSTGK